jgi:hypothetical protein
MGRGLKSGRLGIERKPPPKAAASTARFGGRFPWNLRYSVYIRNIRNFTSFMDI